jgi:hypothetical protein
MYALIIMIIILLLLYFSGDPAPPGRPGDDPGRSQI